MQEISKTGDDSIFGTADAAAAAAADAIPSLLGRRDGSDGVDIYIF